MIFIIIFYNFLMDFDPQLTILELLQGKWRINARSMLCVHHPQQNHANIQYWQHFIQHTFFFVTILYITYMTILYQVDSFFKKSTFKCILSIWNFQLRIFKVMVGYFFVSLYIHLGYRCILSKGYCWRNNQNGGWKWNRNLCSVNKISDLPAA